MFECNFCKTKIDTQTCNNYYNFFLKCFLLFNQKNLFKRINKNYVCIK